MINTVIFNISQANFLFKNGAKIYNIIEGKNGDMGIVFDKNDKNLKPLLDEWKVMSEKAKEDRINS